MNTKFSTVLGLGLLCCVAVSCGRKNSSSSKKVAEPVAQGDSTSSLNSSNVPTVANTGITPVVVHTDVHTDDTLELDLAAFGADTTITPQELESFTAGAQWPQTVFHAQNHCQKKGTGAYSACQPIAKKIIFIAQQQEEHGRRGHRQGGYQQDGRQGGYQQGINVRLTKHTISYRYKCKALRDIPAQIQFGQSAQQQFLPRQDDVAQQMEVQLPEASQYEFDFKFETDSQNTLSSQCAIQILGWNVANAQ